MDLTWLATEAKTLHAVFQNMFYSFILALFVIGIIIELFKIPLGGTPEISQLFSRLMLSVIIMVAVPEVMNLLADLSDSLVAQLGSFNDYQHVKERLREQLSQITMSWVSIKDLILLLIGLVSYLVLLVGLYFADAIFVFAWLLIYVFSPVLSACYVLPATAGATKMLFKSLIEVTIWKCMWAVMGALVWSMAASQINDPKYQMNFVTVIILNLMLFFSLWKVPSITSAFLQSGVSQVASGLGANLYEGATKFTKDAIQLYTGTKSLSAMKAMSKKSGSNFSNNPSPGGGNKFGSHKYRAFQKK
jgi:hypothetical protein